MEIQFNNLRQEKGYTGVIFCDQNCRLIGFGKKLDQLSKKHISNIIKGDESFQNRNSKHYDYTIIHQPENLKLQKLYVFKLIVGINKNRKTKKDSRMQSMSFVAQDLVG